MGVGRGGWGKWFVGVRWVGVGGGRWFVGVRGRRGGWE